ncbi:hypothetical protein C7B69_06320 [filamentous cyanobacterium Phorm 46]|nr:hypothetical protein C7B69_06320 [filamentous cyanobacterium Phorm 46]
MLRSQHPHSPKEDVEPIVNLPELLAGVYDRAGYDYRIDYNRDPIGRRSGLANELLQEKGLRDN